MARTPAVTTKKKSESVAGAPQRLTRVEERTEGGGDVTGAATEANKSDHSESSTALSTSTGPSKLSNRQKKRKAKSLREANDTELNPPEHIETSKPQANTAEGVDNVKATARATAEATTTASANVEAPKRKTWAEQKILAEKEKERAKARYEESLNPQPSVLETDPALAARVEKLAAAAALKMSPSERRKDAEIKERMEANIRQKAADDKRKAAMAVKASEANESSESESESESDDDATAIAKEGFDTFCEKHLGNAATKPWRHKLIGMLEGAYAYEEITSEYLRFICFSIGKCKHETKAKKIVLEMLNEQKQKSKGSSVTSISLDDPIPKKSKQKDIWKRKDRATSILQKCRNGSITKINHTDAGTLFQAAENMDEDRKLEPSWGPALDSIEDGTRSKTIEIFVNANKINILDDAHTRWKEIDNTEHVTDPENALFPFFALRTYLESSCDEKTKRFIEATLATCKIADMACRYDGLVYLACIRETIYPKALQMHLNSKMELMTLTKTGDSWSAYLEEADKICWRMRIGGPVEDSTLTLHIFRQLETIPNIRNINEKIKDLSDEFFSSVEAQKQMNAHDLITQVRDWMNVDKEHWTDNEESEAAYFSHTNEKRKSLSKVPYKPNVASQPKINKFAEVNYGQRLAGRLPAWVRYDHPPAKIGVTKEDGIYKKVIENITFYWCDKCQLRGGKAGRWNKNHPTKAHTAMDDKHHGTNQYHNNKEYKRKDNSDSSYTKTLEKRIRALEAKK